MHAVRSKGEEIRLPTVACHVQPDSLIGTEPARCKLVHRLMHDIIARAYIVMYAFSCRHDLQVLH